MSDFKLFADIIPDFSKLKSDAKKEKITVGVDSKGGASGSSKSSEEQEKQTGILGGMGKSLVGIAAVIGVLSQLEVIVRLFEILIAFINLGIVQLIRFIGGIGNFLSELPSKLKDFFFEAINFLSSTLSNLLSNVPIIGKAFENSRGVSKDTSDGIFSGGLKLIGLLNPATAPFVARELAQGAAQNFAQNKLGGDQEPNVNVELSLNPSDNFFEIIAARVQHASSSRFT